MNPSISAALAMSAILGSAALTSADPITIVKDERVTSALARTDMNSSGPDTFRTAGASDTLTSTVTGGSGGTFGTSTATLVSSFADPMHWVGTGTANISVSTGGGFAQYSASSVFRTTFDVSAPVAVEFSGRLNQSNTFSGSGLGFNDNLSSVLAVLIGFPSHVFTVEGQAHVNPRSLSPEFTGVLAPGQYQLLLNGTSTLTTFAQTNGAGHADYTFRFDLTPAESAPTPEPASLLLLSTGVAGLLAVRSRHANRAA